MKNILKALLALLTTSASQAIPIGTIQLRDTLQPGATFYVSSGTVAGGLSVGSITTSGTATIGGATTITSTGTVNPLRIISNGTPSGGLQNATGGAVNIKMNGIHEGLVVYSSTTDSQAGSSFVLLKNDAPLYNDPILWIEDAGHESNPAIRIDSGAPDMEWVNESTDTANGMGKWEQAIPYQGTQFQVNSRAYDNSTFERVAEWRMRQKGGGLAIYPAVAGENGNPTATSTTGKLIWLTTDTVREIGIRGPTSASASWYWTLPSTFNNAGEVMYQSTNGPDRNLAFTTGTSAGKFLQSNGTSAPTWETVSASGGGGDNLGSHIATMTVTANYGITGSTFSFAGPQQSTVTYGLTVGSLTVSGGSGNLEFSNDQGTSFYQIVGSSTNATVGQCAIWTSSWTQVSGACGSGAGDMILASTQTVTGQKVFSSTRSLIIQPIGNIGVTNGATLASTDGAFIYDVSQSTGLGLVVFNSAGQSAASANAMVTVISTGSLYNGYFMRIMRRDTNSNGEIRTDSPNPNFEFVETDQTNAKFEIGINNGISYWATRNAADSGFERVADFANVQSGPYVAIKSTGALRFEDLEGSYLGFHAADMSSSFAHELWSTSSNVGNLLIQTSNGGKRPLAWSNSFGATTSSLTVNSSNFRVLNYLLASSSSSFVGRVDVSSTVYAQSLITGTSYYANWKSSGTLTPNAQLGNNIDIVLTSSITINVPINAADMQKFTYRITQDAAGSRTVNLGTGFRFGADITSWAASTAASKVDYLGCIYHAVAGKCDVISSSLRGY